MRDERIACWIPEECRASGPPEILPRALSEGGPLARHSFWHCGANVKTRDVDVTSSFSLSFFFVFAKNARVRVAQLASERQEVVNHDNVHLFAAAMSPFFLKPLSFKSFTKLNA